MSKNTDIKIDHPVKAWRKENGITQEDAADIFGVSRWTVVHIEAGLRKPSVNGDNLTAKISKLTGIPREELRPDVYKEE